MEVVFLILALLALAMIGALSLGWMVASLIIKVVSLIVGRDIEKPRE